MLREAQFPDRIARIGLPHGLLVGGQLGVDVTRDTRQPASRQRHVQTVVLPLFVIGQARRGRMGTGRGEQRLSPLDHLARVGIRHAPRDAARISSRRIGLGSGHLQGRHVRVDLPVKLLVPDRGDAAVHQIVESRYGETVLPCHVFGREREVVARFGFQIGIPVDHEDVAHVEVHVHLLEGRGAESACV